MNVDNQDTLHSADGGDAQGKVSAALETVASKAKAIGSNIAQGTEDFSEEARQRVIAARQAAVAAGRSTRAAVSAGAQTTQDYFNSQPLVVGAVAVAFGAALGGLLPRNRFEDEHFGARRDDLIRAAERIYEEERRKLEAVANAALSEAHSILDDKKQAVDRVTGDRSVVGAVVDEVVRAGQQVAEKAIDVADREKLGKPKL